MNDGGLDMTFSDAAGQIFMEHPDLMNDPDRFLAELSDLAPELIRERRILRILADQGGFSLISRVRKEPQGKQDEICRAVAETLRKERGVDPSVTEGLCRKLLAAMRPVPVASVKPEIRESGGINTGSGISQANAVRQTSPTGYIPGNPAASAVAAAKTQRSASSRRRENVFGWSITAAILVLCAVLLGLAIHSNQYVSKPSDSERAVRNASRQTEAPRTASSQTAEPKATSTPRPVPVQNGEILVEPGYECLCPLEVSVRGEDGYYVYLKYENAPLFNKTSIERKKTSQTSYAVEDLSFYVAPGSIASVSVPIGTYSLYYCSGETWFGPDLKFGSDTVYSYSSNQLQFYAEDINGGTQTQLHGASLELWKQAGGNMNTRTIPESSFPD